MVGDVVRRTIDADPSLCMPDPTGNDTVNDNATELEFDYPDCAASVDIAITMAFLSALFMLLFGLLRLGFMTTFLSGPLVSGYTAGAAVHVFTGQLRHIVGVPSSAVTVSPGVFALPRTWTKLVEEVVSGRLNWAAVVVSVLCMIFLVLVRLVNKQLGKFSCYKKLPIPIPSQLIAVIVATLISTLVKLDERYDIDVVGELPTGAPPLTTPKLSHISNVIIDAFIAVVVCYSVTLSLEKVFVKKHDYTMIYPNQVVVYVSSWILLVVLLALGPLFEQLPRAILSSIIIVALQRMFIKVMDIKKYYRLSKPDMFIWIVVFLATVFLGIDIGLGVGVGFAMSLAIVRTVVGAPSRLTTTLNSMTDNQIGNFGNRITESTGVVVSCVEKNDLKKACGSLEEIKSDGAILITKLKLCVERLESVVKLNVQKEREVKEKQYQAEREQKSLQKENDAIKDKIKQCEKALDIARSSLLHSEYLYKSAESDRIEKGKKAQELRDNWYVPFYGQYLMIREFIQQNGRKEEEAQREATIHKNNCTSLEREITSYENELKINNNKIDENERTIQALSNESDKLNRQTGDLRNAVSELKQTIFLREEQSSIATEGLRNTENLNKKIVKVISYKPKQQKKYCSLDATQRSVKSFAETWNSMFTIKHTSNLSISFTCISCGCFKTDIPFYNESNKSCTCGDCYEKQHT